MRERPKNGARQKTGLPAGAVRQALAGLVARTVPLYQRLSALAPSSSIEDIDTTLADERLREWCRAVADGNEELFERRLAWDNLTRESLRPLLLDTPCEPVAMPPSWVETLTQAILFAARKSASAKAFARSTTASVAALPFEELLEPLVGWARREVDRRLKARTKAASTGLSFSAQAWRALERALLGQLSELLAPSLYAEFERRRPAGRALLGRFLAGELPAGERPRVYYQAFIEELRGRGIFPFLESFPVLAKLLGQALDNWCDATAELIERLESDLPLIQTHLQWTQRPTAVVEIEAALSDPHHGGRLVTALTFDSGVKLVYKPRSLQLDIAFGSFLNWCNRHAGPALRPRGQVEPATLYVVELLDRGSYGWAEFVDHAPCSDSAAVERFYFSAGMLLCVLHLLGATDCHYENLVAHGERLVLIDAETIMQPRFRSAPEDDAFGAEAARSWDTVVRTGLLPQWDFSADGRRALDTSGLGSFEFLQGQDIMPRWEHVNTDDMALGSTNWTPPARTNLPILDGQQVLPGEYLEQLVDGFERMYRFFIARREEMLSATAAATNGSRPPRAAPESGVSETPPIAAFAWTKARFIARATQNYVALMRSARQPEQLRSSIDRGILFDSLSRPFLSLAECPDLWHIRASEWQALERLDVPHFLVSTTGTSLHHGDGPPVPVPLLVPGFTDLSERLKSWDEAELRHQSAIIKGVFLARLAGQSPSTSDGEPLPRASSPVRLATERDRLIEAARQVGHELEAAALTRRDGSLYWLSLFYHSEADRYQLEPVSYDLYEGATGIALFLATLDAATEEHRYRELVQAALRPLRQALQTHVAARRLIAHMGIGGASGLGSIVYALTRIADLLDMKELLDDAERAAALIGDDDITRDTWLDVIAGSAGAILGLLTLHRRTNNPALLARAILCGEHLLNERCGEPGLRAWQTFAQRPLTGFAHGAAGVALALLRLHAATGDARFREAAREALAYERSVYDNAARNWPDYRAQAGSNGDVGYSVMWCHGAPGIGLARLGCLSLDDDPVCLMEVEAALKTTIRFGLRGPDYLCCGNLGRAELLLEAGLRLDRTSLHRRALSMATALVNRAAREDGFRLINDQPSRSFKPGFFRGLSGIGYQLLRIATPEQIPSVLLWA